VPLWEFILLSMLLHTVAILLFGAPSGGSRDGRAMWGALNVVIRDALREPPPALKMDRGLSAPTQAEPRRTLPAPAAPAPESPRTLEQENTTIPVPEVLQRLERTFEVPPFEVPKPVESPALEAVPLPPVAPPAVQRSLTEPPKIEAPLPPPRPVEARPLERVAPPRVERQIAEPPKIEAPLVQPPRPIETAPIEHVPAPAVERSLAEPPRIEAPIVQPVPPIDAAPIERLRTPAVERSLAEPPRIEAPIVQPIETPVVPAPRIERTAPPATAPALPRQEIAPATPSVPPDAPQARPAPAPPAASETTPRIERDATPLEQAPAPSPFRSAPPKPAESSPPSTYDPTAPPLDTDAMRRRAAQLTRQGTGNRAALPFPMPPVEKPKTTMESAIEKARKPDCRTAYKDLGLAAIVPLIANEFGEGSCRW